VDLVAGSLGIQRSFVEGLTVRSSCLPKHVVHTGFHSMQRVSTCCEVTTWRYQLVRE
jgi:hypothetical protein